MWDPDSKKGNFIKAAAAPHLVIQAAVHAAASSTRVLSQPGALQRLASRDAAARTVGRGRWDQVRAVLLGAGTALLTSAPL